MSNPRSDDGDLSRTVPLVPERVTPTVSFVSDVVVPPLVMTTHSVPKGTGIAVRSIGNTHPKHNG